MRVLIYSANFAPEPTGIGKYSGEMAAWLAAQGHEVRVVCAPPYYPAWKIDEKYQGRPYARELWQGVDVWRAPLWVPTKPGGLTRVLHLVTFAVGSLPVMLLQLFWRPQAVMVVAPALVCAPAAAAVAKLSGARSWLHIQDFEVDVAFQMGLLKGAFLRKFVLGTERWLLRRFDVVSSISNNMVNRLSQKGIEPARVKFFPNWVNLSHINPLAGPSAYRTELGVPAEAKVGLFSGTLGNKQGLMIIPGAAKLLVDRQDIVFVICGDGAMKPELEAAARQLPNLKLLPLQPFERLSELLGMADFHLLPQSVEAEDLVLPSKLTGMLASGRPVIATSRQGTEIANVVSKCGVVVPPMDEIALASAVVKLADDGPGRAQLGLAARQYAESRFSMENILRDMEDGLDGKTRAGL